jgi:hypothetical protein
MTLQKNAIDISFAQGLDLKTDPFRVQPGKFLSLQNSVFDKGGQLKKRNGYGPLAALPNTTTKLLTTFNGNLTAIGNTLQAYASGPNQWVNKGNVQPVSLTTLPLIRSNTNQSQADSAVAPNGLVCVAYTDNIPNGSTTSPVYKYAVADSVTSQNIINPTILPNGAGSPRVFVLGNFFVIVFTSLISSTYHLQYITINTLNPTLITAPADLSTTYTPSPQVNFDGVVANNNLYVAFNGSDGGGAIRMTYIDSTLTQHNTVIFTGHTATIMSVTADITGSTPVIYASFWDSTDSNGYTLSVNPQMITILSPTKIISSEDVLNITGSAQNGVLTFFYEIYNTYSYNSIQTDYLETNTITATGTVGTKSILVRSVGLGSKSFIYNGNMYFLAAYQSAYQPTYFLMTAVGQVICKLAYENGGGYITTGLPNVTLTGNVVQMSYLYKDLLEALSTQNTSNQSVTGGIYAQTGVNLASFNLAPQSYTTGEIGSNLNFSGGFLWMYDGYSPVEQNFFLYPENIAATSISALSLTGYVHSGSMVITGVSSTALVAIGMAITDASSAIPAGTVVTSFTSNTITMSHAATADSITDVLTLSGSVQTGIQYYYQVTYEWADDQGNTFRSAPSIPVSITASTSQTELQIPTLRLTYKTENPVKIVIYRWSTDLQNYYQITSIQIPLLNNTSVDFVTYVDIYESGELSGNNLIYTTGGVVEDIGPPATDLVTLFNNRLWLVDSEDRNLLWFSKQVIEATPVEMSDLLTLYVAPTTAAQGSTGVITSLAPMDDKLVIFKENALGYINGIGPDNTGSNNQYSDFTLINSVVGCTNQNSIVFMPQGLMFQSNKGIWLLGRDLSTQYIGAPVEDLTTGTTVLSAINVPATNQVRFTLDSGITLLYDYYYAQWGTFVNIPAVSSCIYEELHTYVNSYGQVFQETPDAYLDNATPVLMSFTTGWMNLAGVQGFERFYQLYLLGVYISPFNLNVQIAYDYNPSPVQATLITPSQLPVTWGSDALWGSGSTWGSQGNGGWEGQANVFEARLFPQRQKCEAFQLIVNEISTANTYQVTAGAGLTLTGLNLIVGTKRGFRTSRAARNFG